MLPHYQVLSLLLPSVTLSQSTSLLASRALGFSPPGLRHPLHPLDLPRPVSPPSLSLSVPNGCSPACSLYDLLLFNPAFSTFLAALKLSGLIGLLTQDGPFTVFAPTNAAFDSMLPSEVTVRSEGLIILLLIIIIIICSSKPSWPTLSYCEPLSSDTSVMVAWCRGLSLPGYSPSSPGAARRLFSPPAPPLSATWGSPVSVTLAASLKSITRRSTVSFTLSMLFSSL